MAIIYSSKPLKERFKHDFYPTPIEFCRAAIKDLDYYAPVVLDPGAGDGPWGQAVREKWSDAIIVGVEIRDVEKPQWYNHWFKKDFLDFSTTDWPFGFNLVVGNPPFKFAHQFVDKSLEVVFGKDKDLDGGEILFLFALAFLESQKRYEKYFSKNLNPKEVKVSTRRISFRGDKKSDNTAYALYRWQKDWVGDTTLRWLDWSYDE